MPCFECEECLRGYYSACHRYSFIGSRQAGGFADYVEIPERNALIIPDDMPFEAAAQMEKDLTSDLRAEGYTVTGGT